MSATAEHLLPPSSPPLGFEVIRDRDGRLVRPMRGLVLFHVRPNFSGKTPSGIIVGGKDYLAPVFGIVAAIRHDCKWCVLNHPREDGGLMPGDLFMFERNASNQSQNLVDLDLTVVADRYNEERRRWEEIEVSSIEPLHAVHEDNILLRYDGVLEDPWEAALAQLGRASHLAVP